MRKKCEKNELGREKHVEYFANWTKPREQTKEKTLKDKTEYQSYRALDSYLHSPPLFLSLSKKKTLTNYSSCCSPLSRGSNSEEYDMEWSTTVPEPVVCCHLSSIQKMSKKIILHKIDSLKLLSLNPVHIFLIKLFLSKSSNFQKKKKSFRHLTHCCYASRHHHCTNSSSSFCL